MIIMIIILILHYLYFIRQTHIFKNKTFAFFTHRAFCLHKAEVEVIAVKLVLY